GGAWPTWGRGRGRGARGGAADPRRDGKGDGQHRRGARGHRDRSVRRHPGRGRVQLLSTQGTVHGQLGRHAVARGARTAKGPSRPWPGRRRLVTRIGPRTSQGAPSRRARSKTMAGGGSQDEDDGMIAGINVTPFVDIALVLLIIFMVTAKYIVSQPSIPVDLP